MALLTLLNSKNPLADSATQRAMLDALPIDASFARAAAAAGHAPLRARGVDVLQVNVGKRCNQACHHCHVDAGPDRTEVMPDAVVDACLAFLERSDVATLDITGGAPELHPRFEDLVTRARAAGRHVMDRCNLTITQLPNYAYLPRVPGRPPGRSGGVAALVRRAADRCAARRGRVRAVDRGAAAVQRAGLRRRGIGTDPEPGDQPGGRVPAGRHRRRWSATGSGSWRAGSASRSTGSYTITNMPISRYLEFLVASGNLQAYMEKLVGAFNPATVDGLMCRSTLSVGWDGRLYDCDFNQMIDLPVGAGAPQTIFDATVQGLAGRRIAIGRHCFGCTAGAGSSCGGTIAG